MTNVVGLDFFFYPILRVRVIFIYFFCLYRVQ